MKRFLTLTTLFSLVVTAAPAAEKCVFISSDAVYNCTSSTVSAGSGASYYLNWEVSCNITKSGTTKQVTFKGVNATVEKGANCVSDTDCPILLGPSTTSGKCWCKLVSPVSSRWVAISEELPSYACAGSGCASSFMNNTSNFRTAILSSLED